MSHLLKFLVCYYTWSFSEVKCPLINNTAATTIQLTRDGGVMSEPRLKSFSLRLCCNYSFVGLC